MPYKPCTHGAPCQIVLVEDDPIFSDLFCQWVREIAAGSYEVHPIRDVDELAPKLDRLPNVDAVILDLGLLKTQGSETLIKAVGVTKYQVPIIVLTGGEMVENEAMELGAYALIEKTKIAQQVDREMFLRVVRGAIRTQRIIDRALDLVEQEKVGATGETLEKIKHIGAGLKNLAARV